ncbi:DUF5685 family protein [Nonomuraea sp. MTCD27]|uniref:DUF5685 family protein n=1 Tax=Nonomuraea sp. MTCD27 TaxID=1676747 RepID=UPI0035C26560
MFGIIRPCVEHGCPSLRAAWQAHLCGLCLTLRDGQGHGARLTTNYDTLIVSVLTEAQLPSSAPRRLAGPCALRGFRSAEVVDARASGARLAAAVSLLLAAGRLRDHVADGEATFGRARTVLASRWAAGGARLAAGVGFDPAPLVSAVDRQLTLERRLPPDRPPVLELTAPAEDAVAAAFAHTAVLAGRPGNAAALAEAGRFFGRIAHLLDAAEDRAEDAARGAFNPLTATGTTPAQARRLCDDAAHGLALALREVDFEERHLVDTLLGTEVRRAVTRTFDPHTRSPGASYDHPGWIRKSAAGVTTFLTCGVWRPRWSKWKGRDWDDRCYAGRISDCGCGNCGECCDCCRCCKRCDCCDGGGCDCSCGA